MLGSSRMLTDAYIEKENNDALREMIFDFFELKIEETTDIHMDDVDVSPRAIIVRIATWRFVVVD